MALSEINFNDQKPTVEYHVQALSPAAQEAVEKRAILEDSRLKYLVGDEEILEINRMGDHYEAITQSDKRVRVDVDYIRGEHFCGPAQFELSFSLN